MHQDDVKSLKRQRVPLLCLLSLPLLKGKCGLKHNATMTVKLLTSMYVLHLCESLKPVILLTPTTLET